MIMPLINQAFGGKTIKDTVDGTGIGRKLPFGKKKLLIIYY